MRLTAFLFALTLSACGDDDVSSDASFADAGTFDDGGVADGGSRPIEPGSWTIAVLPDTQILARDHAEIFEEQTRWLAAARDEWRIAFAAHVGDLVDNNSDEQWDVAYRAMHTLDGRLPYVMAPGNHDLGLRGSAVDRSTLMNAYFPVEDFAVEPWFGGTFVEDQIENSFSTFETPSGPWLVVALEFGPRDAVVEWARMVLRNHPDTPTLLVTHAYLYSDDTRYDWSSRPDQLWNPHSYGVGESPEGVNDGEELFRALVDEFDQVEIVVCGHVLNDGLGRLQSRQSEGGIVHQVLANYQEQALGGGGFLRLMTFDEAGTHVDVGTYSPYLDEWLTDADNQFSLELEPR